MRNVIIKMIPGAVEKLLTSSEVEADLAPRAHRIANTAGAADHEVEMFKGRTRWRATVRTSTFAGAYAEATTHNLTRAIDAGR